MRGLDIRCKLALLIATNPHLKSFSTQGKIVFSKLLPEEIEYVDICCEAYMEGEQEGYGAQERKSRHFPPFMFQDEPELLRAWSAGWDSGWDFRVENSCYSQDEGL